jgi:hypothetical protein
MMNSKTVQYLSGPYREERSETFKKWLRRGSKSFSLELNIDECPAPVNMIPGKRRIHSSYPDCEQVSCFLAEYVKGAAGSRTPVKATAALALLDDSGIYFAD